MGLYRYSDESEKYQKYDKHQECCAEKHESCDKDKHEDCDEESARALKCILSLLDELNNEDLRILEDIIERLLCSRKRA